MMRKQYLDFTKGFAIILMIFAHTIVGDNSIKTWIFSFHMPIFFIVSGILTYDKWSIVSMGENDILSFLKKRLYSLGIPYLVWGFILIVFYALLDLIAGNQLNIGDNIFKLLSLQGIDSLWFIPCFLFAELLNLLTVSKGKLSYLLGGGVNLVVFIVVILFPNELPDSWFHRFLLKILVCYTFAYIGYWIGKSKIIEVSPIWISVLGILIGAVLSKVNGFVGISALEFKNGFLFYIGAIVTSLSILGLFHYLEMKRCKLNILENYGKDSIVLLCTNNLLIEIIRILDYKLTGNIILVHGLLGAVMFTLILLILELFIIKISHTSIGILFGKRRIT